MKLHEKKKHISIILKNDGQIKLHLRVYESKLVLRKRIERQKIGIKEVIERKNSYDSCNIARRSSQVLHLIFSWLFFTGDTADTLRPS